MSLETIKYTLKETDRKKVRKEVVDLFLKEKPGTGQGDLSSKYHYIVEEVKGDSVYQIILYRPAPLNKGMDFIVSIKGLYFYDTRRYNRPKHSDVIQALLNIKDIYGNETYKTIARELANVFENNTCNVDNLKDLSFRDYEGNRHPIAVILLAIKWLLIEQDVTYWNWSGRAMLFHFLKEASLI